MPWPRDVAHGRTPGIRSLATRSRVCSTMTELARASTGISSKTGYKWVGRYDAEGPQGLCDRSAAAAGRVRRRPIRTWWMRSLRCGTVIRAGARRSCSRSSAREVTPTRRLAGAVDGVRAVEAPRLGCRRVVDANARRQRAAPRSRADYAPQRGLDHRFQRRIPDRRRRVLLSAHRPRWLPSVRPALRRVARPVVDRDAAPLHPSLRRLWPAQSHPERQRRTVRESGPGGPVAALRVVARARRARGRRVRTRSRAGRWRRRARRARPPTPPPTRRPSRRPPTRAPTPPTPPAPRGALSSARSAPGDRRGEVDAAAGDDDGRAEHVDRRARGRGGCWWGRSTRGGRPPR